MVRVECVNKALPWLLVGLQGAAAAGAGHTTGLYNSALGGDYDPVMPDFATLTGSIGGDVTQQVRGGMDAPLSLRGQASYLH